MQEVLDVEEVKLCELEILKFIHQLCEKSDLRYYLAYGTLLGAVRHEGFIPWDDDIDIMMPRKDYEKLSKLMCKNEKYRLISLETDNNYAVPFAKIVDNDTILKQKYKFIEKSELGVYIDIFILDGIPSDSVAARNHTNKINKIIKRWYWSNTGFAETKKFLHNIIRYIAIVPYKIVGARQYALRLQEELKKYDFDNCEMVAEIGGLDPFIKCSHLRKNFEPSYLAKFENCNFYIPKDYDSILRRTYGDYMKPPKEHTSGHNFIVVRRK